MARKSDIVITAGLNIDASADLIKSKDIPSLEKKLASENVALNINCTISGNEIKNFQQTLNSIAKNPVKVSIEADSGSLTRQAKQIEKDLGLAYPRGETEKLREELKGLISDYKKAYAAEGGYGEQAEKHLQKLYEFARTYRKEIAFTNEDLKYQQERIKEILKEQKKLYITTEQYNALNRAAKDNGSNATNVLNSALGVGRWSTDVSKFNAKQLPYWSKFAEEINQINPLRDAVVNEGDIVQGISDLVSFMSKSFTSMDDSIDKNEQKLQEWTQSFISTVETVTGVNNFADSWENISEETDEAVEKTEKYRRHQELLWQDYEKLLVRINKAGIDINTIGEREEATTGELINYNKEFLEIMQDEISSAKQLSQARDIYSAINKEYQILNAKANSDLPSSTLENWIKKVVKLDSQVKILTVDYEALNNVPDELSDDFAQMMELVSKFDFTNPSAISKSELSDKVEQYTKISTLAATIQAKIQAQVKSEEEHNKALKEAEKLQEKQQHNYWQGRFEETIKAQTAENQVLKDMKRYYQELEAEQQKALRQGNAMSTLANRISKTSAALDDWANRNKKAVTSNKQMTSSLSTYAEKYQELKTRLSDLKNKSILTNEDIEQFRHLNEEIATFKKEADAAGLTISAFFRNMRTQLSYVIMQWVSIQGAIRIVRSLVSEVTAVDTAMTELRKVTEATNEEFEQFSKSAGQTGRELGASVSDVISATAEFARLGESLPDAERLGKVATLYKNVGDGIDIETASEDIVSTMKAFKIEAKDAITIVDKLNEVGNNFAISSGGIGEALKRSASALAAANNDLSESIALITTANTIAQDPTTVGQGIKTVSLRLRSTKTELEEMGEDAEGAAENISKLRDQMLALTGVDIQFDDNTYKSTYQILLEISKVWEQLDDLAQASVLEQLFGKRQANIGAAILENGELLEQVYKKSEGSMGSAMREQQEYAKSIQYSIDTLKAAYQDFADTIINSDFVKNVLKTAQSFLEVLAKIIDEFGTLPTILTGLAAFGGFKGVGKLKPNMPIYAPLQLCA